MYMQSKEEKFQGCNSGDGAKYIARKSEKVKCLICFIIKSMCNIEINILKK